MTYIYDLKYMYVTLNIHMTLEQYLLLVLFFTIVFVLGMLKNRSVLPYQFWDMCLIGK